MVVDGMPGFTEESFKTIKNKASKNPVYCNIVDEMCIRQHIEMDNSRSVNEYINMGADNSYDCDDIPLANCVLIFIVVSLNGYWKLPLEKRLLLAYFLINSLNGLERANLLGKTIEL